MGSTPAPSFDYDRHDMLSNIMGIQQTLGSIRTSIEYINRDIKDLRDRDLADVKDTLREQSAKLSGIDKKIYAAVIILSIIGPIVGFLLERLWPVVASAVGHTG
jgi:tetrahydromethanopterin S-methyltransferase subunit F